MYIYPCVCGQSEMSFKFDIGGPFTGECCAIAKAIDKTKETIFKARVLEEQVEKAEDKKSKKGRK